MQKTHYIRKAHLYRYKLKYKYGAWTQKGKFTTNSGLTGTFTLLFFNGYQKEYYIFLSPKGYKEMSRQTFLSHKERFCREILKFVKPKISLQIDDIRANEKDQILSDVFIQPLFVNKSVINVYVGSDTNLKLTFHYNFESNEWVLYMLNLKEVTKTFTSSCWLRDIWNFVCEHEDMKFPLLLHTP